MKQLRLRADDTGSALVLALVFLSLFGIFIAVLLSFTETSIRTTLAVRSQGGSAYAADGGIETAINAIRTNLEAGRDPALSGITPCPDQVVPDLNGVTVTVTCQGQTDSGKVTTGSGANPSNKPKRAILTLGTETGIEQGSNSGLRVRGGVFSNSGITNTASSASLDVEGDVAAVGDCDGTINTTLPPLKCANRDGGAADPADGQDPDYAPRIPAAPARQTVPACPTGSAWRVDLQPGYYDDATALSALASGSCSGKVLWFQPGSYYFDFQNTSGSPGKEHEWSVNDPNTNIVGGTPKGWSTDAVTRPTVPVPGACKTDQDAAPNDGVQFIFGGDSRINVQAGKVELCAQPSATDQQIAVYGLKTGTATTLGPTNLSPTAPGTVPDTTEFTNPEGAFTQNDGSVATAGSIPKKGKAGLMLNGFAQATVPAGSIINSAQLRVRHAENAASLKVTITPAAGDPLVVESKPGSCTPSTDLCVDEGMAENTVDLQALTPALSDWSQFPLQSVKYEVNAKNGSDGTATLDGVWIVVTYTPPAFRQQSDCVSAAPYNPSTPATTCALVKTSGAQTSFVLQGSIYAPRAAIDIELTNVSTQAVGRGVVARTLHAKVTPASTYTGPTIAVPEDSAPSGRADRVVTITAYVGGVPRARAVVTFRDGNGATPGQSVDVNSWSVLR